MHLLLRLFRLWVIHSNPRDSPDNIRSALPAVRANPEVKLSCAGGEIRPDARGAGHQVPRTANNIALLTARDSVRPTLCSKNRLHDYTSPFLFGSAHVLGRRLPIVERMGRPVGIVSPAVRVANTMPPAA